ncbi:hypothetical protein ABID31_002888 [Chryseobacterium flavum]
MKNFTTEHSALFISNPDIDHLFDILPSKLQKP